MTEYWFARRFPLGAMRSGMAPIHWKGWAVSIAFAAAIALGAAAALWFASRGESEKGFVVFAAMVFVSGVGFIGVSHKKGDHIQTVADYRGDKTGA